MNSPERVWIVIDPQEGPQFVAVWEEAAHEHIVDAINCDIQGAEQWVIREYRLHRPIQWRTGVPTIGDMTAAERHGLTFAVRLDDGSVIRKAEMRVMTGWEFGGWEWENDCARAVVAWCPEDEMPTEGETT